MLNYIVGAKQVLVWIYGPLGLQTTDFFRLYTHNIELEIDIVSTDAPTASMSGWSERLFKQARLSRCVLRYHDTSEDDYDPLFYLVPGDEVNLEILRDVGSPIVISNAIVSSAKLTYAAKLVGAGELVVVDGRVSGLAGTVTFPPPPPPPPPP